jgi:hypothetical protein
MEALKYNFFVSGYFKNRGYEDSAELGKYEIESLPQAATTKEFSYTAKQLFDKHGSAKLKNHKFLNAGGEFLANNQFGFAVVVVSAGMEGDSQKDLVLTEAWAVVVREKETNSYSDPGWGTVQLLIYPAGTEITPNKQSKQASGMTPGPRVEASPAGAPEPR